jgi:hypothetical protein
VGFGVFFILFNQLLHTGHSAPELIIAVVDRRCIKLIEAQPVCHGYADDDADYKQDQHLIRYFAGLSIL